MHENRAAAQRSTEGMVDYDGHSSAQQTIIRTQDQQIRGLVEHIGPVDGEFRVVDYGCGPGTSAITAVRPAIEASQNLFPSRRVAVCHADQPGNDWNALFGLVWGPLGYRADVQGVRTEAALGSFYDQMVADASVDLATCFAASHWLDGAHRLYSPGSVWFADLTGAARQEMAERAQHDWTRFLQRRAREPWRRPPRATIRAGTAATTTAPVTTRFGGRFRSADADSCDTGLTARWPS